MIVRMAKITIMGPKELLLDTLTRIHQLEIMQIDEHINSDREEQQLPSHPLLPNKRNLALHRYYQNLSKRIDAILSYFPEADADLLNIRVQAALQSISKVISSHLQFCKTKSERLDSLSCKITVLQRYKDFLTEIEPALGKEHIHKDLDYFGFEIQKRENINELKRRIEEEARGCVVLEFITDKDNNAIGLVVVEKNLTESIKTIVEDSRFAVIQSPLDFGHLVFSEQQQKVHSMLEHKIEEFDSLNRELLDFSNRWLGIYQNVKDWLQKQLAVIDASACVYETHMCFFIYGWVPDDDLPLLTQQLDSSFDHKVVVEELEIVEKDLEKIPTALKNPAYFRPFEIFSRILPIPSYGSFDLTPFIGIFFPIFFGMMLGDIGYGLILLIIGFSIIFWQRAGGNIQDAGKILIVSSIYTIFFGGLYGELFGTAGHKWFGLKPLLFDRHASIIPMLCFALAAGIVHVVLGLVLGVISSFRRKEKKEAWFKLLSIIFVVIICFLGLSVFMPPLSDIRQPLLVTVAVIVPVLLLTGGILAPLELLKNIGNIISYARIMAVGLTSALLAYVANYMAGMSGSIWAGIVIILILHTFNLLLGVFAPTIHSLRLHYVEFLSKFASPGGKPFQPLGKNE